MGHIRKGDNGIAKFQSENLKGRDHLEDLDTDGKILDLKKTGYEAVDWIQMAVIGFSGELLWIQ